MTHVFSKFVINIRSNKYNQSIFFLYVKYKSLKAKSSIKLHHPRLFIPGNASRFLIMGVLGGCEGCGGCGCGTMKFLDIGKDGRKFVDIV